MITLGIVVVASVLAYAIIVTVVLQIERKENAERIVDIMVNVNETYFKLLEVQDELERERQQKNRKSSYKKISTDYSFETKKKETDINISVDNTGRKTMELYPIKTSDKAITISWKDKEK